MMKRITHLFLCLVITIYFSCGSNDEQTLTSSSRDTSELQQLQQLITKYPDSLLLVEKMIQYYREEGEYDSALAVTQRAINKAPHIHGLWSIKGTLEFENGDTGSAIRSFEQAIDIFPLPDYLIALGTIYAQKKDPKALTIAYSLTGAIPANMKTAKDGYFIKGLYYNYTGDKKKAIALFDSSIRDDYTYMFAYREKAIALYDQAKYEDALKVLEKAVTVQNNFDEGYYWMGNCYKKLNKKEKAIESYHRALMYDKDFIEARDSLKTLE
jgi:tetratricopeptide (TPR) repeat protein